MDTPLKVKKVYQPFSGGESYLVLRERLRGKRPAGKEMPGVAYRLGYGEARGLDG
jgi:hypothetical protein